MAVVTIMGAGMTGSALASPARENGQELRLVGTQLDREIIETSSFTRRHIPNLTRIFLRDLNTIKFKMSGLA